jgi:hypothetical protein
MPELSRFFGIVISMYSEIHTRHHQPHFHAYYQGTSASLGVDPVELLAGSLPPRQRRLVEAWAELHRDELMTNWWALQAGQPATAIDPLK